MKKLSLLIAFMLLVGMATSVQADVEVTCFDGIFERATGAPVAKTVYFPGIAGPATIRVYNGAEDDSYEKVSSSIISVNGNVVFSSSNFSQGVSYISAEVDLIEGRNSLVVLLKSKPGGKIRVEIVQEVEADGAAVVGTNGGEIEVVDPDSPINGVKIFIPEGNYEGDSIITVEGDDRGILLPPESYESFSPGVKISSSYPLTRYVKVILPLNQEVLKADTIIISHYDDVNDVWNVIPVSFINYDERYLVFFTPSFSIFRAIKFRSLPPEDQLNMDIFMRYEYPLLIQKIKNAEIMIDGKSEYEEEKSEYIDQ